MANFNKVIIMGNMTRDPELTYLPSQTPVVEFGLATTRRFRGSDGQMREDVCFVDCRCYGNRAETINKYCQKGRPLLVEGRLQFDRWEAQDGTKRSKHRIFVENFSFVDSRGGGEGREGDRPGQAADSQGSPVEDTGAPAPPDDDIPF